MPTTTLKKSDAMYKGSKLIDVFLEIEDFISDYKENNNLDLRVDLVVSGDVAYLGLYDIEPKNKKTFECYFTFRNGVLITTINNSETKALINADWVFEQTTRDTALRLMHMASVIGVSDGDAINNVAVDF